MNTFETRSNIFYFFSNCKDLRTGVIWSLYIGLDNNCGL